MNGTAGHFAEGTVAVLAELVGFDTVSHNSNLAMIARIADRLGAAGARIRLTHDDAGGKANLLASIGPERDGGILLSGHSDVVPVAGQAWSGDPFELAVDGDRLRGRGTADMKGFLAAVIAAAPGWAAAGLVRPVHIAISYDEELGCLGVPRLVADLQAAGIRPALAVIGEPTGMRIADRHRGYRGFRTRFRGRAAHSSDPTAGASAIGPAAAFVGFVLGIERPPETTVSVGRIDGGTAINIVPEHCRVLWEIRSASAADEDALGRRIDGFGAGLARDGVSVETEVTVTVPPLEARPADGAVERAAQFGGALPAVALPFGTEAGYFQAAGIASVVCGPGSIDQAHRPDEWIAASELAAADRFMRAVGHSLSR